MFKHLALASVSALLLVGTPPAIAESNLTDAQVRQAIIRESIANYSGNCPCPYNTARNGSSCGGRSAYSRAGGYAPMCFPSDVSKSQVDAYRRANSATGGR